MDHGFSTMARGLTLSARRFPDKPALIEIDRLTLSYRQLQRGAAQVSHLLRRRGVRVGDNVAVLSGNSIEHIVALYAVSYAGAVSVALDPKWTATEISRAIEAFDSHVLIVDEAYAYLLSTIAGCEVVAYACGRGFCDLISQAGSEPEEPPPLAVKDHDPCTIILTSGTTGVPKGVVRSSRNVEMGCMNGALGKAQNENGRELAVVPIFYGSGRGSVVGQIYLGATVYLMANFEAEHAAHVMDRERITAVALAPTMCRRLLRLPNLQRFDFSALRSLRKAGSPFTLTMANEIANRITPHIYQGYASTETGSVTLLRPDEQVAKLGSAGRLEWGVEADIVSAAGRPLPTGSEGEIRVRGPNVCVGYYKNAEEERKVFRDGWFHTGDIGRFDDDGYLYVVGRIKETIKTGSINVSPREVELVLGSLDGVEDVAVIGVPDAEWGEAVTAFVMRSSGSDITPEAMQAFCRTKLAGYKIPKSIRIVDEIERNGLGKVTPDFRNKVRTQQA